MSEKRAEKRDEELLLTVTDDEITAEQKVARRSFLSATGLVLAGAAGIVSSLRASAQGQEDPDKRPDDARKKPDDAKKKADDARKNATDAPKPDDARKKTDDARKRSDDPHKTTTDPDRSH
jgi:hypothetical protein